MEFQLLEHSTTMELQSVHDLCFKVLCIYIYIVVKDTSHYDIVIGDLRTMVFVITIKNIIIGLCQDSKCTIFMAIINVFYNYKCNHICMYFSHFDVVSSFEKRKN
jgi:hypothetical protein